MKELITAIGLLLFIEGILYALFPSKMKNMLKILDKLPINQLRITGLFFALVGFIIVWYLKSRFRWYFELLERLWYYRCLVWSAASY